MHLPAPTHNFTIPSVHDGIDLECRIYLPHELLQADRSHDWRIQGAIVSHPYAPLGGCYDDPVVGFIGGELLRCGYVVGTFNFRGAGESGGRTSWTAKPELADYVSFYGFMLCFLHSLKHKRKADGSNLVRSTKFKDRSGDASTDVHLILGGYSYGSLIASHLPTIDVVTDLFVKSNRGTLFHEICQVARGLANVPLNTSASSADEATEEELTQTAISYLLVSPLLPPVNLFLTFFSKLSLDVGVETSAQNKQISCPKPTDQLCSHQTLTIYGNHDTFTSAHKLRKWSHDLSQAPQSRFQSAEIDGAGHFWREHGVEAQARETLRSWLRRFS